MNKRAELIRLASEQGQPPQVIAAILDILDAHPELIDFPRVISELRRLLRVADVGAPVRFRNCDPLAWREACDWLISLCNQPLISHRLGELFWLGNQAPSRNPVLNKGVKRYGFPYAALWHAPRDAENSQDYERLISGYSKLIAHSDP